MPREIEDGPNGAGERSPPFDLSHHQIMTDLVIDRKHPALILAEVGRGLDFMDIVESVHFTNVVHFSGERNVVDNQLDFLLGYQPFHVLLQEVLPVVEKNHPL